MEWYRRNLFLHSNYTVIRKVLIQPPNERTTTPATLTVQRAHRRHFFHEEQHFVKKEKRKNRISGYRTPWSPKGDDGTDRWNITEVWRDLFLGATVTQIQPLRIHDIAIPTRHVCLAVARYRCTPARLWIKSVGNWPACWQVGFI